MRIFNLFFILVMSIFYNLQSQSNVNDQSNNIAFLSNIIFISISKPVQKLSDSIEEKLKDEVITITDSIDIPLISTNSPMRDLQSLSISDTANYLKNIPGFTLMRNGGTNNDIMFRGMYGSRIRVLMDHGDIIGACSNRMDPPGTYIVPETFDILNIIKGPQTVLFGPATSSGMLQFQRYHPNFINKKIRLLSNISIGSNNNISKNIDSVIGNKYGYLRLIGNTACSDDYYDGGNHKVHSAWYKWSSDAIIVLNPINSNSYIELNLGQGNGSASYPSRSMDGLCFARENYTIKIEKMNMNKGILNKIDFNAWYHYVNHVMGNNSKLLHSVSYVPNNNQHCCYINNNTNQIYYKNSVDRLIWGTRGIMTYQWDGIICRSGMDMQINKHGKISQDDFIRKADCISQDYGVFSELIWESRLDRKFVTGIRFENSVFDICMNSEYKKYKMKYPAGFIRYENHSYPSILYYTGVGTSQRFPDYLELTSIKCDNIVVNKIIDCVFQLKPEKTIQLDSGIHFQNNYINGWISSYFGYVKDFILFCYENNNIFNSINNVRNICAGICGSELGLNYQFNKNWNFRSNLTWTYGFNFNNYSRLLNIPPVEGKLICEWNRGHCTVVSSCRIVAPQYVTTYNKELFLSSFDNKVESKSYFNSSGFEVFAIYIERIINQYYKFSFGIDNLLNCNYKEYLHQFYHKRFEFSVNKPIHEPGRTFWIKFGVVL